MCPSVVWLIRIDYLHEKNLVNIIFRQLDIFIGVVVINGTKYFNSFKLKEMHDIYYRMYYVSLDHFFFWLLRYARGLQIVGVVWRVNQSCFASSKTKNFHTNYYNDASQHSFLPFIMHIFDFFGSSICIYFIKNYFSSANVYI